MVPSLLDTCSLGSIKSSWLVLSLLFGCAGALNPNPCRLPPVSEGTKLTTITHDGLSRSWYTYVPTSVAASTQADVRPLVVDLHGVYMCGRDQHEVHRLDPKGRRVWVHLGLAAGRGRSNPNLYP